MSTGKIQVYYGEGRGKTSAALGYAIHEASKGESVIVIQFLKQKDEDEISFLGRLEPEIRLFRFQKSEKFYRELPAEEQLEEQMNMKNGISYARKVLQTGECDILILDEVLSVGDMFFRKKSEARIKEMIHGGSTVLIVSHSMDVIKKNCDKVVWIEKGDLKMVGTPKEVCPAYEKQNG